MNNTSRFSFLAVLFLFSFLTSGCAVAIKTPGTKFNTPEALGSFGDWKMEAGWSGTNEVELTPAVNTRVPNTETPTVDTLDNGDIVGAVGLGLPWNFDVEFRNFNELFVRWQFLGKPASSATTGNFSSALTGSFTYGKDKASGDEILGSGKAENKLTYRQFDGGLVLGYRPHNLLLIYGGPSYNLTDYDGTYASTISGLPSREYTGVVRTTNASLGVEIGERQISVKIEGAYSHVVAGQTKQDEAHIGAMITFRSFREEKKN